MTVRLLPFMVLLAGCSPAPVATGAPTSEQPAAAEQSEDAKPEPEDFAPAPAGPASAGPPFISLGELVEDASFHHWEEVSTRGRLVWGEADCVPHCSVEWILVDTEDPERWHYVVGEFDSSPIVCRAVDTAREESPCGPDAEPDPSATYRVTGMVDRDAGGYSFMIESIEPVPPDAGD